MDDTEWAAMERCMFIAGYVAAYSDIRELDRRDGTLVTLGTLAERMIDPERARAAAASRFAQRDAL